MTASDRSGEPRSGAHEDDVRRVRLIAAAAAAASLYLAAAAGVAVYRGELIAALAAVAAAVPAAAGFAVARAGRLAAAEWTTAGLFAIGAIALIAVEGPVSSRLGMLQIGVVLLGLAARPWMALAGAGFAVAAVDGAAALGVPIAPGTLATPMWLVIAYQIALTTALMMTYTHGYRRLLAALARRTATLEAAHTDLVVASEHLEHQVDRRSAELERAAADLDAFASTIAHDLRAPLRHVQHYLELVLDEGAPLGEARLAPIAEVLASAAELTTTMEAILAAHRPAPRTKPVQIMQPE